jgi:hypothetical protein
MMMMIITEHIVFMQIRQTAHISFVSPCRERTNIAVGMKTKEAPEM